MSVSSMCGVSLRSGLLVILLSFCFVPYPIFADISAEPPILQPLIANQKLAPMALRLPAEPLLVNFNDNTAKAGVYGGGGMRMLMGRSKDIRLMVVYGYARLVGLDQSLKLVADILKSYQVEQGRIFTFTLRRGHKWSDGAPFTSEDFRYYWEDIINDEELSPFGPNAALLVDGEIPTVEIIDPLTVRYSWSKPNPVFLNELAGPRPLFIFAPSHYLKQFHRRYAETDKLDERVAKTGVRDWASLHLRKNHQYKSDNPDLPTLQPWHNTTFPPAERFIFKRNPFYHKVDENGLQLPYIDKVEVQIVSKSLIAAKTGAGESDLQSRYLALSDYTFIKKAEDSHGFKVALWSKGTGSQLAIYPNLNSEDATWRELFRDVRFRRALSLGVNRHEINQVVYYGLGVESNNSVLKACPLFKPELQSRWSDFDLKQANALLDELGLIKRNKSNLRLLPDGRPMEIILHTAGESTEETDVLELIKDSWARLGIKLFTRPSQREVFRERVFSGQAMMAMFNGIDNGLPSVQMSPQEFVPVQQVQLQWPKWGQYYETKGEKGETPELSAARRLVELYEQWKSSTTAAKKSEIWSEILDIHSDQVFSIGLISSVPQPVVINSRLRNVPHDGVFSWSPTAYFGLYHPDTFWFDVFNKQGVQ